ncbi:MAG: V-type ATPase subunit, partial [Lachnospiraceae bacterium]|nr:V-type ATPase subunit [Lachnospiraceae bacterium]
MGSSKAANAVLAKVRAKYGRRLTEKDYASLLSCQQVSEIVSYLKNNTYYSTVLAKVNEKEVHRGRLEVILKQKLFDDFYSLCLYTKGAGEHFSKYILEKNEIEQIIHFLTLLSSGSTDEYIFSMPTYFMSHTSLDLERLARATTYDQFYDAVAGSPYAEILAEFRPKASERINISHAEHKLYTNCYKNLYNSINKYTSGGERKALKEMFNSIMYYTNFVRV